MNQLYFYQKSTLKCKKYVDRHNFLGDRFKIFVVL